MNDYNQQMSTISALSLFDTTKEERASFITDVINRLDEVNPIQLHLQLKCMEEICDGIKDSPEYKAALLDEVDKYGDKSFEYHNAEISKMEAGVKYDFIMCGDSEYDRLDAEVKTIKAKLDARAKFLKTIPASGLEVIDPLDQKKTTIYPPSKSSTTTIKIKLK